MPGIHFSEMDDNKDLNLSIFAFIFTFSPWDFLVILVSIGLSLVAVGVVDVDPYFDVNFNGNYFFDSSTQEKNILSDFLHVMVFFINKIGY